MGSIVSSKKQSVGQSEVYPTESYAQEAKHRQAALQGLHLPLVRKLSRKDAFDLSSASDEDDIREWYPAGVSPWFYNEETGVLVMPSTYNTAEGAGHWMDGISISAMELHRAAIIIQRVIRGYQTRKSLIRENEGATKIQRTYRSYKRRQSVQLLGEGMAPSYLKTFTVSDSVAKDDKVSSENGVLLWQDPSSKTEHGESKKQIGVLRSGARNGFTAGNTTSKTSDNREVNYSYLKIVEGIEPKEIIKAVEVPIQSVNSQLPQSSSHSGSGEISRQDLAAAAKLVIARREFEEISTFGEKKAVPYKGPISRHVLAARQALTPSPSPPIPAQGVVATSMRTWTPEMSYSPKPISPDSGLGRLTESRESEKSVFSPLSSVRGYGTSNGGPMGSLPSLKDSLPSLRGSLPSLKELNPSLRSSTTTSKNSFPGSLRDPHPDLREATVITNYESSSEHSASYSGKGLQDQNSQERKSFQNPTENSTIPMPFRLTRPWPALAVQIKPDSNDAQEIAKAVVENGGNHFGIGGQQEPSLGMHPVMYASNSLKATVRKASRAPGSTPNRAAELMKESMMRKNEEKPKFMGDPISTVKGTNYQRLMNELREQRKIEMQQREAERAAAMKAREESSAASAAQSSSNDESSKSKSRVFITSRTRQQPKNATTSSTRGSVLRNSKNTKTANEDENNISFIPQLSIITEDETCDDRSTFSFTEQICPVPPSGRSSNTLTVPNNNQHLLKMDPLIKMLYQEISEGSDTSDTNDRSKRDHRKVVGSGERGGGGEGNEGEEGEMEREEEEKEIELTPELIERVRTAIIKRQLSKKGTRLMLRGNSKEEAESSEDLYGKDSILIAPPDLETLLKAAEFRGGVVKKLKHLTTSIRLDYHEFINSVEQTLFYAAQQAEASLDNYHPPTVLLISSSVPKCKILRNAAKPGVIAHVYDFTSSLTDLLNDIAQLLESFRPGAKAKNFGIVCKGGPGYFYLVKKVPVTPAKLRNRDEILQFWQGLGHQMSKLYPGQSVIHMMESNVAGNRQGENLLSDLEAALYSHQVKVLSPLEMAPSGREMLNCYFDPGKHKLWKMMRYTKLRLYK